MTRKETIKWLESLKAEIGKSEHRTLWHYAEAIDMAIEALSVANLKEEFESAVPNCKKCAIKQLWKETEKEDLVSVVRCKDCRYYWGNLGEDDTDEMYGECRWDSDEMPNADDYCSYGERKE